MLYTEDTRIAALAVHIVGNKAKDEPLLVAPALSGQVGDTGLMQTLTAYFAGGFKSEEYYNLHHETDLACNEVYNFVCKVFDDRETFYDNSVGLARHLYETGTHPQIKGGEFYVVYFTGCRFGGEVSTKYNVGIETGFFNELKINADFFYERRENIFLAPQFSEISGLPKDYTNYANMGLMENRGFEVSAEYVKRFSKDLTVSVRGNFTFARNKVIDDGKYYAYPWQDQRGVRYGLTMGYRAMHLFSQEELDNMPDYYTQFGLDKQQLRAGDIRYEDLNDDGKITEADMTWIGNPAMPEIVYGFGASLNYKGFDFSFLFQGGANRSSYLSGGWYFYPFQADRGPKFMGNVMTMFKDRWTVDNPDPHAFSPRLSYGADANNYKTSTWWQRDSDYLRLKNVEIGYTLPSAWASKLRCSSLRIYATGVNLFTISKFISDYWDPETGADAYPMQRQVFVGVNLTF